jgi:CHASE2 domain-containing sensor protein
MAFSMIRNRLRGIGGSAKRWLLSPPTTLAAHLRQNLTIGLAIIVLLFLAQDLAVVRDARDKSLDWLIRINHGLAPAAGAHARPVVFYDIDEQTYTRWNEPFHIPRAKLARLIDAAAAGRPAALVIDIELDRAAGPEDQLLLDSLRRATASNPAMALIVVKSFRARQDGDGAPYLQARRSFLDQADPAPAYHPASPVFERDDDGQVRRWRIWQGACDERGKPMLIPSVQVLVLAALNGPAAFERLQQALAEARPEACAASGKRAAPVDLGAHVLQVDRDRFSQRILYTFPWQMRDGEARAEIAFGGRPTKLLDIVPAYTITEGDRRLTLAPGHLAVIGASYGDARDLAETPLGTMPGSLVLINAIESLLLHGQLSTPPLWLQLLSGSVMLVAVSLIFMRFTSLLGTLVATAVIIVLLVPLSMLFYRYGVWIDFAVPVIAVKGFTMIEEYRERLRVGAQSGDKDGSVQV